MLLPFSSEQFCLPSRDMKVLSSVCRGVKLGLWPPRGEHKHFLVLRTGFGPKREEARGGWRKLTNELYDLCLPPNVNSS